jgi:hypothetical protein
MKLKYETKTKAIGETTGKAGYGGWTTYTTGAKTVNGLRKRMREEADKAWERRERFYQGNETARRFDVYDEDHVWCFHTYAPLDARTVMRYELYAVKRDGMPTQFIEAVYDGKNYEAYKAQVEAVEKLYA